MLSERWVMKTHIMQFTYFWIIVTLMPTSLESLIIDNAFFFLTFGLVVEE